MTDEEFDKEYDIVSRLIIDGIIEVPSSCSSCEMNFALLPRGIKFILGSDVERVQVQFQSEMEQYSQEVG